MAYCWTGKEKSSLIWNPQDVFVLGIFVSSLNIIKDEVVGIKKIV